MDTTPLAPTPGAPAHHPETRSTPPIQFERRSAVRRPKRGNLLAVILGGPGPARLAPVQMTDESATGMGLTSSLPATPGQSIGLYVPGSPFGAIAGLVARCERHGTGWRLGLRTRQRMVA